MKPIQLFQPTFRIEECLEQIRECLAKGWTGLGFKTSEFEEAWKNYSGFKHAHFLASNTVGLHLALHIFKQKYNWQNADEIITTPLTFVSTNHAILYENLKPVFADIDENLCLDPISVESKITNKTRAIIFVGMGGNLGQYPAIKKLCDHHNLTLILDAAHMAGSRFQEQHIGLDADATVFSYQAVKNLPTADSGMICFKEEEFDKLARKLTWLGIDKDTYARTNSNGSYKWKYEVDHLGFKYHGNSIMAALGLVGLKYLDEDNAYRRQLVEWYTHYLNNSVEIVPHKNHSETSRHLFQIKVDNREKLLNYLNQNNVYPGVHYRDNTEYALYHAEGNICKNARNSSERIISLPLHLGLRQEDVEVVGGVVRQFVSDNREKFMCHSREKADVI